MKEKKQKVTQKRTGSFKIKCAFLFLGLFLGIGIYPVLNPSYKKLEPYVNKFYQVCLESAATLLEESSTYISKAQRALKNEIQKKKEDKPPKTIPLT